MFNKIHVEDDKPILAFIKSSNIQVFPCGRRRSTFITDYSGGTTEESGHRIPFDPEARLNTEANNRKHSSLNGYSQTYFNKWDNVTDEFSISVAGYLFSISSTMSASAFGGHVFSLIKAKQNEIDGTNLSENDYNNIYVNIIIEDTLLFSGFQKYYTGILHNQFEENLTEPVLDLLVDSKNIDSADSYCFSGLSFSLEPLTGNATDTVSSRSQTITDSTGINKNQLIVSLRLLSYTDKRWKIYEPARLPNITHGPTENSVFINELYANKLTITDLDVNGNFNVNATGDISLRADQNHTGSITAEGHITAQEFWQGTKQLSIIDLEQSTNASGHECWQLKIHSVNKS